MAHSECSTEQLTVSGLSPPSACEEESSQQEDTEGLISSSIQRLWGSYRDCLRKHQVPLQLVDDLVARIVFWIPPSSHDLSEKSRWREVVYGLVSLNRLVMDLAVAHDEVVNSYGTSLKPATAPTVPATTLRILLTVTHNLMPTVLELVRSHPQKQTECRLWLERIKFMLRLVLLTSYWNQLQNEPYDVVGGLLQDGGMYYSGFQQSVPTAVNVLSLRYRREYVGRRTGRRVMSCGEGANDGGEERQNRNLWIRLMVGEILRSYRPLYWAQAERNESKSGNLQQLWKAWILALVMDVTSLKCLSGAVCRDNPVSQAEKSRRRLKLFLYLLRSPVWERTTEPTVLRTAGIIRRVPLLGRLVENYLWEWLFYWKHPFVCEEE